MKVSNARLIGLANCRWFRPGGWRCRCCGPKPKDRPRWRRRLRRVLRARDRKTNLEAT